MEAERDKLVVIFAGYKDRMDDFFRSNPGLSSRVAHHIDFPDYDVDELMAIAHLMLDAQNYVLGEGGEEAFRAYLERRVKRPALRARTQRPQLDRPRAPAPGEPALRGRHAAMLSRDELMTITPDDILMSSVFAEDREPEDEQTPAGAVRARKERRWARSIILGIVGDSAAGKTTLSRGIVRVLGEDNVTHVCVDDYHRYDRRQRAERNITPLHPDCNYMDIMAQHLAHMRAGEPFLKPVYQHKDGTFGPLVRVDPKQFSSRRRAARLLHAKLRGCSTCASTSPRRRSCGASGRCSATARGAATRPTRC